MCSKTKIVHRYNGIETEYTEWDGVLSMADRLWHSCPVCGMGVTSPIGLPMAHKECIRDYTAKRKEYGMSKYVELTSILIRAIDQASKGKGKERHAEPGEPFEKQQICEITRRLGSGGPLYQAVKKIYESQRLDKERGIQELLGAINYIAAAIIVMEETKDVSTAA